MKISIDQEIFNKWPQLKVGAIIALGIKNTKAKEKSLDFLREEEKKQQGLIKPKELKEQNFIKAWRRAYVDFGANPKKYQSSIEALLTRVLAGGRLPDINPLVNFYNGLSLKHHLPFGGEDLDKVKGNISLVFAKGGERGKYINSNKVEAVLPGEAIYRDEVGFTCRRFNWREADRTKFTPKTNNVLLIAELLPPGSIKTLKKAVEELSRLVQKYLGGEVIVAILDKQNPVLELDFEPGSRLVDEETIAGREKEVARKKTVQKVKQKRDTAPSLSWFPEVQLRELIWKAATKELGNDKGLVNKESIRLEHPSNLEHGDYSTNVAMVLAKKLKKNPRDLAKTIVDALDWKKQKILERVELAGPGFINFYLSGNYLIDQTEGLSNEKRFKDKLARAGKGKTMVIDYSAPNIAKPFGIGHLRSTNIGQTIYNLYRILGWKTIGDNHLGDWGTQFGKLIVAIKKWWDKDFQDLTIKELEKLYVKFHEEAKNKPELEDEGRLWFKKLEEGDKEAKRIWQFCTDISLKEFNEVYRLLGVKIDYAYGEAFYHFEGWMNKVLQDVENRGLLKMSQGAKIVDIPKLNIPAMLIKSDGGTTYLLRDLATIKFRMEKWKPDLIAYEVGADQKFYFQQVFSVAEKLGYIKKDKLVHIAHGMIRWADGKFSTRKGKTIHLEKVIKEGVKRAEELVEQSATDKGLSEKEKKQIAKAVGIGGIKFNDLKQEPEKDIIFDWDKILALEGYSAPYLQYTYARCASVLRKAGKNVGKSAPTIDYELNSEESLLLHTFYRFSEITIKSAENFAPHLLAQYLFDLAQKFNLFYQKHRILNPDEGEKNNFQEFRLFLTAVTGQVLKTGLEILGIEVLEKM